MPRQNGVLLLDQLANYVWKDATIVEVSELHLRDDV